MSHSALKPKISALLVLLTLPLLLFAQPQEKDYDDDIYGCAVFATAWGTIDKAHFGIYRFSSLAPEKSSLVSENGVRANGGAVMASGRYYCYSIEETMGKPSSLTQYVFDIANWKLLSTVHGVGLESLSGDLACDHVTGKIYGSFVDPETEKSIIWGELDPKSNTMRVIKKDFGKAVYGVAIDAEGNCFAIAQTGEIYCVEKETGEATLIGDTGLKPKFRTSAMCNQKTGELYFLQNTRDESALYKIDRATAEPMKIYDLEDGYQIQGGFFMPYTPSEGAPAAVEDLAIDFPLGALEGTVSFKTPVLTGDGSPLSGSLRYHVIADGKEKGTGTASAGQSVAANLSFYEKGEHDFIVYCEKDDRPGVKTYISAWIGPDRVKPVKNLSLSVSDNGRYSLEWESDAETEHGGYADWSLVNHHVYLMPDKTPQGEPLPFDCEYTSGKIPEYAETYRLQLGVQTGYEGEMSEMALTEPMVLGAASLPYSNYFISASSLDCCQIIDANNDGTSWYWVDTPYGPCVRYAADVINKADDYLVLPPMNLAGDRKYDVEVTAYSQNVVYDERLEIRFGQLPEPSLLDGKIMSTALIDEGIDIDPATGVSRLTGKKTLKNTFSPAFDGTCYIALHCVSPANQFCLNVTDVKVSVNESGVPGLEAETGRVDIYGIDGVLLRRDATPSDVPALPRGIYIIFDGRKAVKVKVI